VLHDRTARHLKARAGCSDRIVHSHSGVRIAIARKLSFALDVKKNFAAIQPVKKDFRDASE
jgi:hypothetical protein